MHKLAATGLALALLCGCSQASPSKPESPLAGHAGSYEATAHISHQGREAAATISQSTPEACTVVFTAPDSLKDMTFVFQRDSVEVGYKGLAFRFGPNLLPGGAAANVAVSAINRSIQDDGIQMVKTDADIQLTGTLEAGAFTLYLEPQEGRVTKLSLPGEELEIKFENFRFLD